MLALATPARHSRARLRWVTPIAALVAVSVISLAARVAFLGSPCHEPCTSASAHVLVFDESYYVNAARVIAGVRPPPGAHYRDTPAGDDPNAEHPQLAKVVIAGAIELFGDGPLAWRLPSILLGSLAILGMFALVRSAGGGPWVAVGAAALMAADNLLLVHSRIATLDIYAVTAMIWAAVLYLRGRPLLAGAVIGVGACAKEVAPYVLLALLALELLRAYRDRSAVGPALVRVAMCAAAAAAVFVGLLALLDVIAPPFDPLAHKLVGGGVFGHIRYLLHYGSHQTSPHGPQGIASYPWGWLVDIKPILYLNINPQRPVPGLFERASAGALPGDDQPGDPAGRAAGPGDSGVELGPTGTIRGERRRAAWVGVVCRDFRAVRAAERDRQQDELPLLHGDRDAGDLRRCGAIRRTDQAAAALDLGVGRDDRDRGHRDVPVHAAAVTRSGPVTSSPIDGTPARRRRPPTGPSCRSR